MMLSLGDFQFGIDTAAYAELAMKADYPWATVERLQNTPQYQAMGKETRSITLPGTIYPSYRGTGMSQMEKVRAMAAKMEPQILVTGKGKSLGRWIVKNISQTDSLFFDDGTPQKQDFTIELERFDT
jgi:phage protein U